MKRLLQTFCLAFCIGLTAAMAMAVPSTVSAALITVVANSTPVTLTAALFGGSGGFDVTYGLNPLIGTSLQQGSFGSGADIGIDSGLILTTGRATAAVGPNNAVVTFLGSGANYAPLGANSNDANVLKFKFTPSTDGKLVIQSVFATEECQTNPYPDSFGLFVGGSAIASGSVACPLANVNGQNAGAIQYQDYTDVLTTEIAVMAGNDYDIALAIADGPSPTGASDRGVDSALFLSARFQEASPVPEPDLLAMVALAVLSMSAFRRQARKGAPARH